MAAEENNTSGGEIKEAKLALAEKVGNIARKKYETDDDYERIVGAHLAQALGDFETTIKDLEAKRDAILEKIEKPEDREKARKAIDKKIVEYIQVLLMELSELDSEKTINATRDALLKLDPLIIKGPAREAPSWDTLWQKEGAQQTEAWLSDISAMQAVYEISIALQSYSAEQAGMSAVNAGQRRNRPGETTQSDGQGGTLVFKN